MTWLVIAGFVYIIVGALSGTEFSKIAEMKGYQDNRYFWWSFLLGPVGWAMVIALPDRSTQAKASESTPSANNPDDELPDL